LTILYCYAYIFHFIAKIIISFLSYIYIQNIYIYFDVYIYINLIVLNFTNNILILFFFFFFFSIYLFPSFYFFKLIVKSKWTLKMISIIISSSTTEWCRGSIIWWIIWIIITYRNRILTTWWSLWCIIWLVWFIIILFSKVGTFEMITFIISSSTSVSSRTSFWASKT